MLRYRSFGYEFKFILKAGYVQNQVGFPLRKVNDFEQLVQTILAMHTNNSTSLNKLNMIKIKQCIINSH